MFNSSKRRSCVSMVVFVSTVIVGLALDRVTKIIALAYLPDKDLSFLGGIVKLHLLHNPGASLGFGSTQTWLITLFAVVVSSLLIVIGLKTANKLWALVCGLTVAGALGNIVDRINYATGFWNGRVVDFIDYGPFVGNVADIILAFAAIGIITLVVTGQKFGIDSIDSMLFNDNRPQTTSEDKD